jgi:outer membrane protein
MRKIICLLAIFIAASIGASAQNIAGFFYQASLPTGETKDFIDKPSWLGFGLEGRQFINENASVGMYVGYNKFEEFQGGENIAGNREHKVDAWPILFTSFLYFGDRYSVTGYIGGGIGTYYIRNRVIAPTLGYSEYRWHFGVAPEFGLIIRVAEFVGFAASAKYNSAFKSGNYTHSYWSFSVGFVWATY